MSQTARTDEALRTDSARPRRVRLRYILLIATAVILFVLGGLAAWKGPILYAHRQVQHIVEKDPSGAVGLSPVIIDAVPEYEGQEIRFAGVRFVWPGTTQPKVRLVNGSVLFSDDTVSLAFTGFSHEPSSDGSAVGSTLFIMHWQALQEQPQSLRTMLRRSRHDAVVHLERIFEKSVLCTSMAWSQPARLDTDSHTTLLAVHAQPEQLTGAIVAGRTCDVMFGMRVTSPSGHDTAGFLRQVVSSMRLDTPTWNSHTELITEMTRDLRGFEHTPDRERGAPEPRP